MKKLVILFAIALGTALVPSASAWDWVGDEGPLPQPEVFCAGYAARVVWPEEDYGDAVLEIEKWPGGPVLRRECGHFGQFIGEPGRDVTGDGVPDLAFLEYSGGMHCCNSLWLYELGDEVRLLAEVEAGDGWIEFSDVDGDLVPELLVGDNTFAYWDFCYADSPIPEIVLRWDGNGYVHYSEWMEASAPARYELEDLVRNERAEEFWAARVAQLPPEVAARELASYEYRFPPVLLGKMFEFVHAGNPEAARELLEIAWGGSEEGREAYYREFLETVRKGRFCPPYLREEELEDGDPAPDTPVAEAAE